MKKRIRALPDGKETDDAEEYIKAWHDLAHVVEAVSEGDLQLIGYDPEFSFRSKRHGDTLRLPVWFVQEILDYIREGN